MSTTDHAQTLIERVRALHQPVEHRTISVSDPDDPSGWIDVKDAPVEIKCSCTPQGMLAYPCPTAIALDTPVLTDDELLPVKVYEQKHPLANGVCENCGGEMVYNLSADVRRHTAETKCADPWPAP